MFKERNNTQTHRVRGAPEWHYGFENDVLLSANTHAALALSFPFTLLVCASLLFFMFEVRTLSSRTVSGQELRVMQRQEEGKAEKQQVA